MAYAVPASAIDAAERRLGRTLPPLLRERLLRDNGGEVNATGDVWQLHPVWDGTSKRTMRKTAAHLVTETESARSWARFPRGAVAIASNGTGDLLLLLPEDDDVKHWNHATGEVTPGVQVDWS